LITFDIPGHVFSCTGIAPWEDSDDLVLEVRKKLENEKQAIKEEDSAAKVQRLAEQMRFRIKEAMAQRGGSAAFVHWLQSDGGKKA
jgi:hypothetical protein